MSGASVAGESLDEARRASLLAVARAAIEARLGLREAPDLPETGEDDRGAFVSLHERSGALRGCVGRFRDRGPLEGTVARVAVESAFRDPRFAPLSVAELEDLVIEISVLGPMEEFVDPAALEVGRHGAVVERGGRRGVLLPQVASGRGWDAGQFLDQVCRKAGLAAGDWKRPGSRLERFTAEIFREGEVQR